MTSWAQHPLCFTQLLATRTTDLDAWTSQPLEVRKWGRRRLAWAAHSRFHVGVRVAIGVHGSQVCAAHDANQQALLLRTVLEGDEDAAPLLQGLVFCLVHLWGRWAVTQLSLPAPTSPAATGPGQMEPGGW